VTEYSDFDDVEKAVEKIIESQLETIKELDDMDVDVTPWEADFLQGVMNQLRQEKRALSQGQIEIVRRMCNQYDVECDL